MPGSFTLSEPHPTVPQGSYTHSGRGGAGNYFRAPKTTPPSGVAVQVPAAIVAPAAAAAPRRFFSGRGGAGNAHPVSEAPPTLDLDQEYLRAQHRDESGAGHVGRGGAGNFYKTPSATSDAAAPRKSSSSSSRRGSAESGDSARSGLWARISGHQ